MISRLHTVSVLLSRMEHCMCVHGELSAAVGNKLCGRVGKCWLHSAAQQTRGNICENCSSRYTPRNGMPVHRRNSFVEVGQRESCRMRTYSEHCGATAGPHHICLQHGALVVHLQTTRCADGWPSERGGTTRLSC
jgi:hypothetical protein